ncbi:MAG: C39 family peptidase, partial [Vampirovibrionia bacterium]
MSKNKLLALVLFLFLSIITINFSFAAGGKVLDVPYMSQEDTPDCLTTTLYMIIQAINPNIYLTKDKLVNTIGEYDGIAPKNSAIEKHSNFNATIQNKTGVAAEYLTCHSNFPSLSDQLYERCSYGIQDFIIENIDKGRPVGLATSNKLISTTGHAALIIGYSLNRDGKTINTLTFHDPVGFGHSIRQTVPYDTIYTSNGWYS